MGGVNAQRGRGKRYAVPWDGIGGMRAGRAADIRLGSLPVDCRFEGQAVRGVRWRGRVVTGSARLLMRPQLNGCTLTTQAHRGSSGPS
jgi:hypothetical protein